jgi:hypothetical protein
MTTLAPGRSPGPSGRGGCQQFHADHSAPTGEWIFVFGSNLAGRHGKGAARMARTNFRAEYGCGQGPTGRAYAIPTKDRKLQSLRHPHLSFFVTRVGCGLAGHSDDDIGPLFASAGPNCSLPEQWQQFVAQHRAAHTVRGLAGEAQRDRP